VKSWANRAPPQRVVTETAAWMPAILRGCLLSSFTKYLMFVGKLRLLPLNAVTNKFETSESSRPE